MQAGDTICIGDTILTFQINDQFHILSNDIPTFKGSENFAAAKLTFIGLSGHPVSGTMILIKDSSNT